MYNPYLAEEVFSPVGEVVEETRHDFFSETTAPESPVEQGTDSWSQFLKIKEMIKPSDLTFFKDFLGGKKEKTATNHTTDHVTQWETSPEEAGFLEGIVKKFHLETIETGDILLVILVIYFMLEGDDKIELAITLGVLAFFWWADHRKKEETEKERGNREGN